LQDLLSLIRLWWLLRKLRPDIVHSYGPKAGLLSTIAARLAGVPVVALSVFGLPQMTKRGLMQRLLNATTQIACWLADWVWTDSPSLRLHMLAEKLCGEQKLVVLGNGSVNGIDADCVFSPARFPIPARLALREKLGIPAGAMVLGFVGRVVRDKGIVELIEAWRVLRAQRPRLHALLVGPLESGDPLPPEILETIESDDRVHYVGMQQDVAAHLAIVDIFVNPSYREGFGVANAEAAAMRLPVVSTRIPGCVDSVQDGVTGILVPTRDVAALCGAIEGYLDDPQLRMGHGTAGRERIIRDFQPADQQRALETAYRKLLPAREPALNTVAVGMPGDRQC
jgi:glycosyltransferase involved in cell wall biosynthesis